MVNRFFFLLAILSIGYVHAQDLDLKGIKPGISTAKALEMYPLLGCGQQPKTKLSQCVYTTGLKGKRFQEELETLAGVPVDVWLLNFTPQDQLAIATVSFSAENFARVVAALNAKFGPPVTRKVPMQNALGAKVDAAEHTWTKGDAVLLAREYSGSLRSSSLSLIGPSLLDQVIAHRKAMDRDAAKDL